VSNVLIGIIGVILFIGLALAGALFLGPRFQAATIDSKAAAAVQGMQQLAHAMTLMRINEGKAYDANLSLLPGTNPETSPVSRGYLKTLPKSPVNSAYDPFMVDATSNRSGEPKFSVITLSPSGDTVGESVCLNIVRRTGQDPEATVVPALSAIPDKPVGCIRLVGGDLLMSPGYFYVFARM